MINITKNGNVSVILFTDSDYYLFNSGQILAPLGSLTMILDESDMVTLRKSSNNDLLFSAKLGKIKINGVFLTKQNAQTLFDEALGGYGGSVLKFEEVQQLPQTGENGIIYLVPNGDNTFTEWVWLENEQTFEKLGYDVDLSNYYNKTQVDGLLANKQNTLTFDTTPTSGSTNPVTSGGIYNAYYSKAEIDEGNRVVSTALNRLNSDVVELQSDLDTNYYTESEVDTALATKQNTLTFDNAPTQSSTNPVTSGGIVTYLLNNYYNNQWVDMHLLEFQQAMNAAIAGIEENYQPLLDFDSAPTQNSTNPVTSGGLYIVLGDIDTALATIIGSNS